MMEFFLFCTASRWAPGPTQPPIQWVLGAVTSEVKWSGREADHSSPSSTKIKNAWSCTSTPPYVFVQERLIKREIRLHGVVLS